MIKKFVRKNWVHIVTIFIAVLVFGVSISSICYTNQNFVLSHRPYIWAETMGIVEGDRVVSTVDTIRYFCINSPAEIISMEVEHYKTLGSEEISLEKYNENNFDIFYPHMTEIHYTYKTSQDILTISNELKNSEELKRRVTIKYSWLGSGVQYYFEGIWKFDREKKTWQPLEKKAN